MKFSCPILTGIALAVLALFPRVFAQEQPIVPPEQPNQPPASAGDPLREAALSKELQELAKSPLPPADGETESEWREILTPVFEFIEGIPVNTVEQGAYQYRRARIRLTSEKRKAAEHPFHLMQDREQSPELYWGQAVSLHGYLRTLRPIPAPENAEDASRWHEGRLRLWDEAKTVRFVTRLLPEDLPTGKNLDIPAALIGYVFPLKQNAESDLEPLIVARWVRWLSPTLDLRTLVDIKDRALRIREEEADAYYRTLLHAKLVDLKTLRQQAEDFWTERQAQLKEQKRPRSLFVDLFKSFEEDAKIYRGQVVTLTGTLRKLRELAADPLNDYGIETLYEAWIFAEDSQSNPTVVVFTENPANLPEGDDLNVPVKVTGYVFKMYGYESRDKEHPLRVAPLLLAKSVTKLSIIDPEPFPKNWVVAGLMILFLGIGLFVWFSSRKDKKFRQEKLMKDKDEDPPQFDKLEFE